MNLTPLLFFVVHAGAFGIIPSVEAAGKELGLHATTVHLATQGLLHQARQTLTFVQHRLGGLA
jgi:hypothetical protein